MLLIDEQPCSCLKSTEAPLIFSFAPLLEARIPPPFLIMHPKPKQSRHPNTTALPETSSSSSSPSAGDNMLVVLSKTTRDNEKSSKASEDLESAPHRRVQAKATNPRHSRSSPPRVYYSNKMTTTTLSYFPYHPWTWKSSKYWRRITPTPFTPQK